MIMAETKVFDEDTGGFLEHIEANKRAQVTEQYFEYWLDLLPPRIMGRSVVLVDGSACYCSFAFCEGVPSERNPPVAFWRETKDGEKWFAQRIQWPQPQK